MTAARAGLDRRGSASAVAAQRQVAVGSGQGSTGPGEVAAGSGQGSTGPGGRVATGPGEVAAGSGRVTTGPGEVAAGPSRVSAGLGQVSARPVSAGERAASPYAALERRPSCSPRPATREEIVARLFAAFGRRALSETELLDLLHPEIVFVPMTAHVTQAGEPYRGHAGIRRYEADLVERWSELVIDITQIRAAGDAVVAMGLVSGRGAAGSFSDQPATWVVKFRDGRVANVQVFADTRHVVGALVGDQG